MLNGNDPEARFKFIERYGIDAYNDAMANFHKRSVVDTVKGYKIRRVESGRFGTIYMVDGLNRGHKTLAGARQLVKDHVSPH